MRDPKIYLAVDNCFASKRWTRPSEWVDLIGSMGVSYVEASADNECDPLYMNIEYLDSWLNELREVCARTGLQVANFYSGHGTYTTLGLAHTDIRVRNRIQNEWLKPLASLAGKIDAGIGFYCHAFSDAFLQDAEIYTTAVEDLYSRLADVAVYCQKRGFAAPGVEQMYTPHQIPWTVDGSKVLLAEVFRLSSGAPFYLTLDTGHQSGQQKFVRPSNEKIHNAAVKTRNNEVLRSFWLGPKSAYSLFEEMILQSVENESYYLDEIQQEMNKYPYLFANDHDSDTYFWFEELGCYSPIVHLQQTAGTSSSHLPFTEEHNQKGIIFAEPLFLAISKSYRQPDVKYMPPKCEKIYLTLEIFAGTSELNRDIIRNMQDSIKYWRKYIPEDGMLLSEAIQLIDK